jgi:hypothetical protein
MARIEIPIPVVIETKLPTTRSTIEMKHRHPTCVRFALAIETETPPFRQDKLHGLAGEGWKCPPKHIPECFEKLIQASDTGGDSAGLDERRSNAIIKINSAF